MHTHLSRAAVISRLTLGSGLVAWVGSLALVACEGDLTSEQRTLSPEDGGAVRQERDAASADVDGGATTPGNDAGSASDGGGVAERDAGSMERDAGDAGSETPVPVFVAQGYAGRTAVSCDDGQTWVADHATDEAGAGGTIRCFAGGPLGPDCDHHPGRAKGIVYSHGWFVAAFGWGTPGSVRRSRDGVSWETTLTGPTFGGVAGDAESTAVVLGARNAQRSTDQGATWSPPIDTTLAVWNVRRAGYAPHQGGRWILVGEDAGDSDVVFSTDGGATWRHPRALPASCGGAIQNDGGVGYVNGAIVIVGGNGGVCRSTDGGETWTEHSVGGSVSSAEVVSTGSEVIAWGGGRVFRSRDGASWTSTALSPPGLAIGAVARNEAGTFVAANAGWNQWYENQRWYRSDDGVTWRELPAASAMRGHPIFQIEAGWAEPSETCPAR